MTLKFFRPSGSGSVSAVADYTALPATGIVEGQELLVDAVNGEVGRGLVRVKSSLWQPGFSNTQLAFIAANTRPFYAAQVTGLAVVPSDATLSLHWDVSLHATSYKVYRTLLGVETLATTTALLVFVDSGLVNGSSYSYRVVASNTTGDATTSSSVPGVPGALILIQRDIIQAQYGNGMLQTVGTTAAEGAIPGGGRTYTGQIERLAGSAYANFTIYGVRVLLANLRTSPISGGHMIAGWRTAWNSDYIPNAGGAGINSLTENPMAGWASMKVNNDASLPVPASTASRMGAAWTDWLMFSGGVTLSAGGVFWRFFHPGQNLATDYALTFATWGANAWDRTSTVAGMSSMYYNGHNISSEAWYMNYFFADGNGCSSPGTMGFSAFSGQASPIDGIGTYGPPGPSSMPFMSVQFLREAP